MGGDEDWIDDAFRRKAVQAQALSWCASSKTLGAGAMLRLLTTAAVFSKGYARYKLRTFGRRDKRREVAADEFRRGAERLGATWVKLGQLIAAGEGIFPEELVDACSLLHDRVQPESFSKVEKTLEETFGKSWHEYVRIDKEPLAAASIAQTHRGTLRDGTEVIVKVQRRGVARRVESDLRALSKIAPRLVGRIPIAALANPPALIDVFARCVGEELDFEIEATNACDVARVVASYGSGGLVVPRPHPYLVGRRAMVLEYLPGKRLEETGAELGGRVIDTLAAMVLEGALLGGVFHGDLHPGNMAVLDGGDVVLYDFGIVARLEDGERRAFLGLVAGGASGDWRQQLVALMALGALPSDGDIEVLGKELQLDKGPIDPREFSPEDLSKEMARLARTLLDAGARLPKPLMLWGKNLAFLDAAIGRLCPERDLVELVAKSLGAFAGRHGAKLAKDVSGGFRIDRGVIEAAVGADGGRLSWSEMRERRKTILERQRRHDRRRGRSGGKTSDTGGLVAGSPGREP